MRLNRPTCPRGYSIIELMVAITISLIILAALVGLFAGNSRERGEIERANQQTENGRYALQIIGDDLRDAGYLASFNPGTVAGPNAQLVIPAALPNACATDVPTLNRAELGVNAGGAAAFNVVPLVEGVENLQLEYGLDTAVPTTGTPAVYTADPSSYNGCVPAPCNVVSNWRNVVTAKINVLTRNLTPTQGYTDTKTYALGLTFGGVVNTIPAFNDGYKRHVYYSVARLNNPAGRNSP